ncbi:MULTISPECIES: isocyanide synthase family protein [unclassified Burkholderia]|uniref:isocyanide synthase family protein n=1 Tax=unclassified Burkholderia TaxID=2613784 RepID=UPI000B7AA478|nr:MULTISPECIES: isocyanide synthase family protein [unclassified Burkholderia]NIE57098.1 L-tyrosine/L-tryptophan isonitrile synthase family protein [Burkholderia sp. Ap-955]NIF14860.1 L-tyrosine/L-tryptophan isonitrile synthase family protein [Burkholderia sp. Ax-1735]NIG07779.1 L-tyrosine/L-tryptophan isonitrile synthase family protein [Burkholderia sp. Tr-849]OXI77656.1 pyoverdine biosynthesis protein PvcA [Burkholderia sp. AU33423]
MSVQLGYAVVREARDDAWAVAEAIVREVFVLRNLHRSEDETPYRFAEEARHHIEAILPVVERGEPVTMILPAFPGKSPNRSKTLGALPDLAEKHALANLARLCRRIGALYAPGAKLMICSDGYCFSDVVNIPDPEVRQYLDSLEAYAGRHFPGVFEFFDLDDTFCYLDDLTSKREELLIVHSDSVDQIKRQCAEDPAAIAMYRGITRFLFEDTQGIERFKGLSNTAIQKMARSNAYRVIQRSNAWGRLIDRSFPNSLRLSIHPQFRASKKIGIRLVDCDDVWLTPWHSVAVRENDRIVLKKRSEIDERNSVLVFTDGIPCHFVHYPQPDLSVLHHG